MATPLVTVGLPTCNRREYLANAIERILNQTFSDFELLVSDNASSVDIESEVKRFNDPRIQFHRQSANVGAVRNANDIIRRSVGKHVIIHHDDDVMMPNNLEKKVELLEANPNVGFVHSNFLIIDSKGKVVGENRNAGVNPPGIEEGRDFFERMLRHNPVGCPTVMLSRAALEDVGYFNEKVRHSADIYMWIKMSLFYDVGYIADPLIELREHPGQDSWRFLKGYRSIEQSYTATVTALADCEARLPELGERRRQFERKFIDRVAADAAQLSQSGNLRTVGGSLAFLAAKKPRTLCRPGIMKTALMSLVHTIPKLFSSPTSPSQDSGASDS